VASIKGRYEYDDDDLTPGKKKEGGLHQNLFDGEGNLKGSARFIPDEEQHDPDPEPVIIYEPVYVHDEQCERRFAREREENAELVAKVVVLLIEVATPHARRLWREKARPAIEARQAKRAARKALKAAVKQPIVIEATVVDSGDELAVASEEYRINMSSAEAQARYLAALAARAFSDEQVKLVANANIVDGAGLAELRQSLASLPPRQLGAIIQAVEANPSVLDAEVARQIGGLLGTDGLGGVPIEERREK
jgi:hypothetical protein